ncbi:MAG: response regulator transcription factor [Psychroserpens sp.]|nr:response regulator transcription factor [Psychroserpens sp.]
MKTINIVLLDDHDLIYKAIKSLIQENSELSLLEGFQKFAELKTYLESNSCPDILLLDISLNEDIDGIKACQVLSGKYPELKIIMLSSLTQSAIVMDAFKKGAKGFLPKNINLDELTEACRTVMTGNTYVHKAINLVDNKPKSKYEYIPKITRREREVLKLIMEELTSSEIAERLFISQNTVENHRASLFSKTGSKNIVGLIKYTIEKGLLDDQ